MFVRTVISIFLIVIYLKSISGVSVIPERTTITYCNPKYISNFTANVRRSSRRGEYVVNMKGTNLYPIGNNATFNVLVFEHSLKYNQYVRTFIEFHYKVCDMIRNDRIFGAILRQMGVTRCPIPAGPLAWMNMTLQAEFDFSIPFVKGKAEAYLKSEPGKEIVAAGELYFHIEQNKHKT